MRPQFKKNLRKRIDTMYLARWRKNGKTHYTIRQSYVENESLKSRDLYQLGSDPTRHIVYIGGNGYYFSSEIQDALADAGVATDQNQLDDLLFEFLDPRIQRIIAGFDRGRRRTAPSAIAADQAPQAEPHLFDKRRFHYLRFGHSEQRHINRLEDKIFRGLYAKSRDELEQYFMSQERRLKAHELPGYVTVIFELNRFVPEQRSERPLPLQMDDYFISRLCGLNADKHLWADPSAGDRLREDLIRYAVMYFDYEALHRSPWQAYVEDFIRRHRVYHPPRSVIIKKEEAAHLFGLPWQELKKLDAASLSRLYRRLALKHHPDQGGDPALFRRLTTYYRVLSKKNRW